MSIRPLLALVALVALGCNDKTKVSEEKADGHATEAAALVDKDIEDLRRGLPAGGKKLGDLIGADKDMTPAKARSALKKTREAVIDLQLAKSTFFTITDLQGVAYASDLETDGFSGKNVLEAFKGLEKAREGTYTEVLGSMEAARGLRTGDDLQWAASSPIPGPDGKAVGLYISGWSLRRFAQHIEEQLKSNLRNASKDKSERPPLLYAMVLHGPKAYGTPVVPEVNVKVVEGMNLPDKLKASGAFKGQVEITNRGFGVSARSTPKLCDTCAVVVLRSEI